MDGDKVYIPRLQVSFCFHSHLHSLFAVLMPHFGKFSVKVCHLLVISPYYNLEFSCHSRDIWTPSSHKLTKTGSETWLRCTVELRGENE